MALFWTCAQTLPRQEALAIRNLRRQNFTSFWPFTFTRTRHNKLVTQPLFPNYVFVQLDDTKVNWAPINSTLGVSKLLTTTAAADDIYRWPCVVPFVDNLRKLRMPLAGVSEDVIPQGTLVRVKAGPFTSHTALVTMSSADRVSLLLEVFSRKMEVEFHPKSLEIIKRPAA